MAFLKESKVWGMGMLRAIKISFRNWFRGPITVQYPFERLEEYPRSRWEVKLKLDDEGQHKCTACMSCVKACSHHCIEIFTETAEDRTKTIRDWHYEMGSCINCGLCVEACPFDAIEMGHDYELAEFTREELIRHLILNKPAAKPKRSGAAPASGEAVKGVGASASGAGLTEEEKAARIAAAKERMAAKKAAEAAAAGETDEPDKNATEGGEAQ